MSPALLTWLEGDLTANALPIVFMIGHEPAFPQPDAAAPHRLRHDRDSLDAFPTNRDAFWSSLPAHGVKAYICGHTHNYSTGAPSTFVKITVWKKGAVTYETYRQNLITSVYKVAETGIW